MADGAAGISSVAEKRIQLLRTRADSLFEKRGSLLNLWQELALQFYPERADFTLTRYVGEEFASHLATSYPMIVRRDLGNAFAAMLRPAGKPWFDMVTSKIDADGDVEARRWLDDAKNIQRRAMYDTDSGFTRATKEADHDFATFGQAVLTVELNRDLDGLSFRCWHLRDCAWAEDESGKIGFVVRKWNPDAQTVVKKWPKTVSQTVKTTKDKDPFAEVACRHIVLKTEDHDVGANAKLNRFKWTTLVIEQATGNVLEEVGSHTNPYVIPRWQTVSGSQYAYSPATVVALADARLLQSMTAVLLEAGEKAVDPPMVAKREAIRSDIEIYAGGITWADAEYDERLGDSIRELYSANHKGGIPLGIEMQQDTRTMLQEAFYLNKLSLPPPADGDKMTAYEAGQRVTEYIRNALPLFEPMENDYNGALCERTFDVIMFTNGFGPRTNIPQVLAGSEIKFRFQTPLQAAMEQMKIGQFQQAIALLSQAVALDPSAADELDMGAAYRDALGGVQVPGKWLRTVDEIAAIQKQREAQQQTAQTLAAGQQASEIAKNFGAANKNLVQQAPVPALSQ